MAARDNRRYVGPEKTTPIHVLLPPPTTAMAFLTSTGHRTDGRKHMDMRKMYLGVSNISQAKGSSYVEIGNTKVVCGVYGPNEVAPSNAFKMLGQVVCEVKFAPFSCRIRRSPMPDRQVKELSSQVKEALVPAIVLDQYPKSQIEVFVSVVEDGGGLLGACLIAASLALCDAKISMYDIVVATSLVWHKGLIYLDPSLEEEEYITASKEQQQTAPPPPPPPPDSSAMDTSPADDSHDSRSGSLTVGLMPLYANGQVPLMVQSGCITADQLLRGLDEALLACRKVYAIVKQVLLENTSKKIEENSTKDDTKIG